MPGPDHPRASQHSVGGFGSHEALDDGTPGGEARDHGALSSNTELATTNSERDQSEVPDSERCVICCVRRKDTLLAPCGHVSSCMSCALELRSRRAACPICRN